jgi:hypothetical protein
MGGVPGFFAHYHSERNHQGLQNQLIQLAANADRDRKIHGCGLDAGVHDADQAPSSTEFMPRRLRHKPRRTSGDRAEVRKNSALFYPGLC